MTPRLNHCQESPATKRINSPKKLIPALAGLLAIGLTSASSALAIEPGWTDQGISITPSTASFNDVVWSENNGADRVEGSIDFFLTFSNLFFFDAKFTDTASAFSLTLPRKSVTVSGARDADGALTDTVLEAYLAYVNDGWTANGKEGTWEIGADNALVLTVVRDSDGDGVNDDEDACPDSILTDTVIIGEIDSGVANTLFLEGDRRGCTLADLVQACADISERHGEFVRCVAILAISLRKEDVLARRDVMKLVRAAARSGRSAHCPRR